MEEIVKQRELLSGLAILFSIGLTMMVILGLGNTTIPSQAFSGTLYVSPSGNDDTNNCSNQSTPCRSVQHAIASAMENNEIQLAAGSYTGTVTLNNKKLTLTGAGVENTIIDGSNTNQGIYLTNASGVTITNVTIQNGTGIYGGGIYSENSTMLLVGSRVYSNTSNTEGAGIYLLDSDMTISNCVIISNTSINGDGGGINAETSNLYLDDSAVVSNKTAGSGGGLTVINSTTIINHSAILDNHAKNWSGGIHQFQGNMSMENSLVSGNSSNSESGGITVISTDDTHIATARINNVTISGNSAMGYAGGLDVRGEVTATNTTIAGNIADSDNLDNYGQGGGISQYEYGKLWVSNTLIADNLDLGGGYPDCYVQNTSEFHTLGYNLVEENSICFTPLTNDQTGVDPHLATLQNNHGPSIGLGNYVLKTQALLSGSPAIDAGDPAFTPPPYFDQRGAGFPRVVSSTIDIGAYEFWPFTEFLPVIIR